MQTNPDLLQRGIEAARAKRTDEARELLMRVVELDERNEQAWLWLSGVVESYEDRRVCLENVLEINPNNQRAQAGLRWLDEVAPPPPPAPIEHCPHCDAPLPASGQTCPACKQPVLIVCPHCGQFTEIYKPQCVHCGDFFGDFRQHTKFYITLANAYLTEGKLSPAQWAIDQAVASAPHAAQDWARIAEVRIKLERPGDAIAAYQQALAQAPDDVTLHLSLHDLYRKNNFEAEAQATRDLLLRTFQDQPEQLLALAQALMERRVPSAEARRFYERAVEVQPQNVGTRLQLGALCFDSNDLAAAREHFAEAVKLTEAKSPLGQQARQALARARSTRRAGEAGGNDRVRQTLGPFIISIMAALANAQLSFNFSPISWLALIGSGVGAYLWQADYTAGRGRRSLGFGLWLLGLGVILIKV